MNSNKFHENEVSLLDAVEVNSNVLDSPNKNTPAGQFNQVPLNELIRSVLDKLVARVFF